MKARFWRRAVFPVLLVGWMRAQDVPRLEEVARKYAGSAFSVDSPAPAAKSAGTRSAAPTSPFASKIEAALLVADTGAVSKDAGIPAAVPVEITAANRRGAVAAIARAIWTAGSTRNDERSALP
jgi:hypothetical protein